MSVVNFFVIQKLKPKIDRYLAKAFIEYSAIATCVFLTHAHAYPITNKTIIIESKICTRIKLEKCWATF